MENSLKKLLKKLERDPTVGSKVMDHFSWYSGRVGGIADWTSLSFCSGSSLLHGKQPTETSQKMLARSNGRI